MRKFVFIFYYTMLPQGWKTVCAQRPKASHGLPLCTGQASWVEEERVDAELDEVKCAMICEALDYPDLRRSVGTLVWHNDQLLMRQVFNLRSVDQ